MLEKYGGKSEHDWEVYAECVREAIGRQGGFVLDNHTNREKLAYENLMCGRTDEATIDGKTFKYSPGGQYAGQDKVSNDDDYKAMQADNIWNISHSNTQWKDLV